MSDNHDTYIGSKVQRWTKWAAGFIKVPSLDCPRRNVDVMGLNIVSCLAEREAARVRTLA